MYMIPNIQHIVLEYQKDTNKGNCLMNLGRFIKFIALKTFPHNAIFFIPCICIVHFTSFPHDSTFYVLVE